MKTKTQTELLTEIDRLKKRISELETRVYPSRPPFVIDYAKTRLEKAAIYLGTIIEREQSFQALRAGEQQLLAANQQLTASFQQLRLIKWHNAVLTENNAFWMVLDNGMYFIQKPLTIHALAATLRQALDNK